LIGSSGSKTQFIARIRSLEFHEMRCGVSSRSQRRYTFAVMVLGGTVNTTRLGENFTVTVTRIRDRMAR
jgi:hypothetical protein